MALSYYMYLFMARFTPSLEGSQEEDTLPPSGGNMHER